MRKMLKFVALLTISAHIQAKEVTVPGLFISAEETRPPGLPSTATLTITCAIISTKVCYIALTPDNSKLDPRVVNGDLAPEDQYSFIKTSNEIYSGNVISHFQHNQISETGELLRVHVLTISR